MLGVLVTFEWTYPGDPIGVTRWKLRIDGVEQIVTATERSEDGWRWWEGQATLEDGQHVVDAAACFVATESEWCSPWSDPITVRCGWGACALVASGVPRVVSRPRLRGQ